MKANAMLGNVHMQKHKQHQYSDLDDDVEEEEEGTNGRFRTKDKENSSLQTAKSLTCKSEIMKILKEEIEVYKAKFNSFFISTENFSKASKIEIDEFASLIKNSEDAFSSLEKEAFVFCSQNDESKHNLGKFYKLLIKTLEMMSLKLVNLKKSLEQSFKDENRKPRSTSSNDELNLILDKIDKVLQGDAKVKKSNSNQEERQETVKNTLKEIKELQLEKEFRLNLLKAKEKELAYYENLPKNCDDLGMIIKLKKNELEKFSGLSK